MKQELLGVKVARPDPCSTIRHDDEDEDEDEGEGDYADEVQSFNSQIEIGEAMLEETAQAVVEAPEIAAAANGTPIMVNGKVKALEGEEMRSGGVLGGRKSLGEINQNHGGSSTALGNDQESLVGMKENTAPQ